MSVYGEFNRSLEDCVALLREIDPPDAARIAKFENAAREGRRDLTSAANGLLVWLETAGPPEGVSQLQCDELAHRVDHVASICRVIVGGT